MGEDEVIEYLKQARDRALGEVMKSRELSLVVTKIDEAILWRQRDLELKTPAEDFNEREHGTKIRQA